MSLLNALLNNKMLLTIDVTELEESPDRERFPAPMNDEQSQKS